MIINFCIDKPAFALPLRGDFNGNGFVSYEDLKIFAGHWLDDCTAADCGGTNLNTANQTVNFADFSIFAQNWLKSNISNPIIDNGSSGTSFSGTWSVSGATNPYDSNSVWARDGATYTWSFTPTASGFYDISMWWTAWPSRSTSIPVDIKYGSNTSRVYVNQQTNGGKWNCIGSYLLSAGTKCSVTIISQPDPTSTCADAVQFVFAGNTLIVDNNGPNTSYTGTWLISESTNPFGTNSLWSRDGATYTWNFEPTVSGFYDIDMWWTAWPTRSTDIPVDIEYGGNTSRIYINQQINGNNWNHIGTYPLLAGSHCRVTTISQPYPASTCADAVAFTYSQLASLAPIAIIDSITPNPANPFQTVTFSGHGTGGNGTITGFQWRSSINGILSNSNSFSSSALSVGTHTIYFKVKNSTGLWSPEVSATLNVGFEDIYVAMVYNNDNPMSQFTSMLQNLGAVQQSDMWVYTNAAWNRTFRIHWADNIDALRQALKTDGAHIIIEGHSNYGLGPVFATTTEINRQTVHNLYYIDDDRVFKISSPWVALDIRDFILFQAFPEWWPEFKDGSSGIMPYTFNSPAWPPPFNYYIAYRIPGDPTYYKVESAHNSALQRFPDSGKPAWFAADGSTPNPGNPDHLKYFMTNSAPWFQEYFKPHYRAKTIIFRKDLAIMPEQLKYSRMIYNSCNSASFYTTVFSHGIMFYTLATESTGDNSVIYLRNYMQGKNDEQIWQILQNIQAVYDYYDFTKPPPAMSLLQAPAPITQPPDVSLDKQIDSYSMEQINRLKGLSVSETLEKLKSIEFLGNDTLISKAISINLASDSDKAITEAINIITENGKAAKHRAKDFYVAKKVFKTFAAQSADKLIALYENSDNVVRGNVVRVAGDLVDINSVRLMLIKALDDKTVCEQTTLETVGEPVRICDMAYNQLVLHYRIKNILRTVGTGITIENRDYHINILKQNLKILH